MSQAWANAIDEEGQRGALRATDIPLQPRFESLLRALAASGNPEPLFILDDFEQNQPGAPQGQLDLNADAAAVLSALCGALQRTEQGRLLITGRYTLPQLFASRIGSVRLQPFDGTERAKHARRLAEAEASEPDRSLVARAQAAADGNPRLFEWLHKVLASEDLDTAQILGEMTQVEERFREHILARNLIESLPDGARDVLTRLSFLEVPVPLGQCGPSTERCPRTRSWPRWSGPRL